MLRPLLAICCVLIPPLASGAELHLVGGGTIVVGRYWFEGESLYYETDAGVVGLPRSDVVRIVEDGRDAPVRYRAGDGKDEASSGGGRAGKESRNRAPTEAPPSAADAAPAEAPRFTREQIDASIERLEVELRRAGDERTRRRLEAGLADLHVLAARERLEAGEMDAATSAYERALGLVADHRVARLELGWLELRAGRSRRAEAIVSTGLASAPDDPWLLELRGEIFYRENRLQEALEAWLSARLQRPDDERLGGRIGKVRRELAAERDYRRAFSQHFVLRYDGDRDEELGQLLLDLLEQSWDELTRTLDAHVREPITVILYTRRTFRETTLASEQVAGLFDGKIRLPVGGVERITPALRRVTRHELVHALLHAKAGGAVPRWLHEGLAQRLEPREAATVRAALARQLEQDGALDVEPFSYATSLSFVSFLEARYTDQRLLWFIELLADRTAQADAFLRAFGASREELVNEWNSWLRRRD
ncbi:MAG: tetratricopeptide repeat protein [Acidobacteriota bacterium]|nr:MAG: tetratricopeptide repeat protein [Acidobacteriota bacterium]